MRILFLTYSIDITGADLSMLSLAMGLNLPCCIVSLSDGPFLELARSKGIKTTSVSTGGSLMTMRSKASLVRRILSLHKLPAVAFRIARIARDYDVIYVNAKKVVIAGGIAARIARKPMLWHQRDMVAARSGGTWRNRLSERVLVWSINAFASRVFSVSRAAADTLVASGGRPGLVRVILNGVDPDTYGQSKGLDDLRSSLGIPTDALLIGCFGQLLRWKGHDVLLQTMTELPGAHTLIAGAVSQDDQDYAQELLQQADRLGLTRRVHFLGRRSDVSALMNSVDIVAHPSTEFDPCPRVVIETLHAGTPIVATAVGGVPELIHDGTTGLLVPPMNAPALANALRRLANDRRFAREMAQAGRADALDRFTLSRLLTDVRQSLDELIAAN